MSHVELLSVDLRQVNKYISLVTRELDGLWEARRRGATEDAELMDDIKFWADELAMLEAMKERLS